MEEVDILRDVLEQSEAKYSDNIPFNLFQF